MCPDLVVATQRIASANSNVTTHVYDIRHFDSLKNQYKVMSVPCMVINDEGVSFGKKNIRQVLDLLYKMWISVSATSGSLISTKKDIFAGL